MTANPNPDKLPFIMPTVQEITLILVVTILMLGYPYAGRIAESVGGLFDKIGSIFSGKR